MAMRTSIQVEGAAADGIQVQLVGALAVMPGEIGYIMEIAALRGLSQAMQLHIFDHPLSESGHGDLLG